MTTKTPCFSFGSHKPELLHFFFTTDIYHTSSNKLKGLYFYLTKSSTVKLLMSVREYLLLAELKRLSFHIYFRNPHASNNISVSHQIGNTEILKKRGENRKLVTYRHHPLKT